MRYLYNETLRIRNTRGKQRQCWQCLLPIVPGERYWDVACVWQGEFQHREEHEKCRRLFDLFDEHAALTDEYSGEIMPLHEAWQWFEIPKEIRAEIEVLRNRVEKHFRQKAQSGDR